MSESEASTDSADKAYAEAAAKAEAAPGVAEITLPALKSAAAKPAAGKAPVAKARAAKSPVTTAKPRRAAPARPATAKPRPAKPAADLSITRLKETIMATKKTTTDFAESFKTAVADAQGKAKAAYEKGTAAFGEAAEFTKGNVEALVESTRILGSGLQELTSGYVAESKSAFETLTADVKALAAVQSPVDFFKLQGEIARRNFDKAVAFGSKNGEAVLKLTNDVVAPISGRLSLAVEKVKKAA